MFLLWKVNCQECPHVQIQEEMQGDPRRGAVLHFTHCLQTGQHILSLIEVQAPSLKAGRAPQVSQAQDLGVDRRVQNSRIALYRDLHQVLGHGAVAVEAAALLPVMTQDCRAVPARGQPGKAKSHCPMKILGNCLI